MTHEELVLLLRQSTQAHPIGTAACADDHEVAAYVDGTLSDADRIRLESHFADCERCLKLIGILCHLRDGTTASAALIAQPQPAVQPTRKKWPGLLPGLAAAAALVLAFAVLLDPAQEKAAVNSEEPRATRSTPGAPALEVLAPAPGAVISAGNLVIRWTPVPGSSYYVVRIVTDTGQLVSEHRVTGTEWSPASDVKLESGREYFVRVDAHPADLNSVSSNHVPFTIVNRP